MESKPIRVRRTKNINKALALIEEKFPGIEGDTDKLQRIAEQWVNLQDAGTSKTQKIADIDTRLVEYGVMLSELSNSAVTITERVGRLEELFSKLYALIVEMKQQLAEHDLD